jgi:hypothetical protein
MRLHLKNYELPLGIAHPAIEGIVDANEWLASGTTIEAIGPNAAHTWT